MVEQNAKKGLSFPISVMLLCLASWY